MVVRANDLRRDGWLAALGAVAVLSTALLPWVDNGEETLMSFEVIGSAESLGLLDGWGGAGTAQLWYAAPALAALIVALQLIGRWALSGYVCLILGLLAVLSSVVVIRDTLEPQIGTIMTLVCGALLVVLGGRIDLFRSDVRSIQPW
ncbi:MAG: hypothetical protein V3V01_10705 [Acidimicrobiales bacterium]